MQLNYTYVYFAKCVFMNIDIDYNRIIKRASIYKVLYFNIHFVMIQR